jgi:DNA mismatch repair protein MutL
MKKIKLLTAHEIQYIAAGEVIENWASIVKELIENSIDAKATHIIVRYDEERGILEIQDDGEGIDPLDLPLIFLPHATSKFDSLDTLFLQNKLFFGFRGEALAAISGVSKTEVISRQPGFEIAYGITSLHGKISSVEEVAGNCGTVIRVSELFEHLGARKKYFQSKKQEQKNIFYVITGLALSHPEVAFSFYSQDKLMVHYGGKK